MFLLDTNVVSELRKARTGRAHPGVVDWLAAQSADALYLSATTIFELELGVLQKERSDAAQGRMLREWLDSRLRPAFAGRVLPMDEKVALRWASLSMPDRQPERDAVIAATALEHSFTVVTRNVRDFVRTGVTLLNPWEAVVSTADRTPPGRSGA